MPNDGRNRRQGKARQRNAEAAFALDLCMHETMLLLLLLFARTRGCEAGSCVVENNSRPLLLSNEGGKTTRITWGVETGEEALPIRFSSSRTPTCM